MRCAVDNSLQGSRLRFAGRRLDVPGSRFQVPALNWRAAATAKASSPDLAVDIDKVHAWWVVGVRHHPDPP